MQEAQAHFLLMQPNISEKNFILFLIGEKASIFSSYQSHEEVTRIADIDRNFDKTACI